MSQPSNSDQTSPYEPGTPPQGNSPHKSVDDPRPQLTTLLRQQGERWHRGDCVRVEDLLAEVPALAADPEAVVDVIANEAMLRAALGETPEPAEYVQRFPHLASQLRSYFARDTTATTTLAPTGQAGRYQLLGAIATGGMGQVLRGRDPELDRELAIKVLLDRYHGDPHMLQRFLTEARISGGLQHPGVVPVYELGRLADQRPFLAMKLVQGRTLTQLLQERRGEGTPGSWPDLPRFLGIFGQVCQAMAYAHSKGVIHRDLKPSNIMVGTFGEVQVMDWGLAKNLQQNADGDRTQQTVATEAGSDSFYPAHRSPITHVGTVLGTFAYMPPEQARGEVASLDERCDVFALGAILCQLLTGQPPYEGRTSEEIYQMARHAALTAAWQRLDACGADADLIVLVKQCLAPDRQQRPRHAGAVAVQITAYDESVQTRLRQVELERAAAQARAQAEQKRREAEQGRSRAERQKRRVTMALATSLLLLTAGACAAGLWYQADQARQAQEQAKRDAEEIRRNSEQQAQQKYLQKEVVAALDETQQLHQELHRKLEDPLQVHELLSDIDSWGLLVQRARTALQRAQSLAASNQELLGADLNRRLEQWKAQLQADEKDFQLARELDTIRLRASSSVDGKIDPAQVVAGYATVLTRAGYDMHRQESQALAARMRHSPIRFALVAALDFWAVWTRDELLRAKLLAVSRHADPDPWRDQVRDALGLEVGQGLLSELLGRNVLQKLRTLVKQADVSRQSPQILLAVARRLPEGDNHRVELLRRAVIYYPRDFWLHFDLGFLTTDPVEQVGCYQAALAVRPKSGMVHHNWGFTLANRKDFAGAIQHYEIALALDPNMGLTHTNWGAALTAQGHYAVAIHHYEIAAQLDPTSALLHDTWGSTLAAQRDNAGAIEHFKQALSHDPRNARAHTNWGSALYDQGDYAAAIEHYKQALAIDPRFAPAHSNWGFALAAQKNYVEAIVHYEQALRGDPRMALTHTNWGFALIARKDYGEALTHFQRALELEPTLAEAHCGLGQALRSQGHFARALPPLQKGHQLGTRRSGWSVPSGEWLQECRQLLQWEQRADVILQGQARASGPAEELQLAEFCQQYGRFRAAVRFYSSALAAHPVLAESLAKGYPYQAACAVALTVAGKGRDSVTLTDKERGDLCKQALHWLTADLKHRKQQIQEGSSLALAWTDEQLSHWQTDSALATYRGEQELSRLPKAEQQAWTQLWADVRQLQEQAHAGCRESRAQGMLTSRKKEQIHELPMKAGRTYILDQRSKVFDAFLRLEDGTGKKLIEDDDSGGDQDARIVFTAPHDGVYRIIATSFQQQGTGAYTLTIREYTVKNRRAPLHDYRDGSGRTSGAAG
jgi:serine/threonine-protein kinase